MKLRWFRGQSLGSREQLVIAWTGQALAYVLARPEKDGLCRVLRFGVERQGSDSREDFLRRLPALGFKGTPARVMLRPSQYQVLQIDAPAVPPEELRTAARWQIREMVDLHTDDLTLDVVRVGDEQQRSSASLFVVVAANATIRDVMEIGQGLRSAVDVVDIQDMAQRNLQSAVARRQSANGHAQAALVLVDEQQALLTISAQEELYYTRRIDLGPGFMQAPWGPTPQADGAGALDLLPAGQDGDRAQRLVVEIQRSLDLWDRTWPRLVLERLSVQAGARTAELASVLTQELGQTVQPLEVSALFPGFAGGSDADRQLCWPLLGLLLRHEARKL